MLISLFLVLFMSLDLKKTTYSHCYRSNFDLWSQTTDLGFLMEIADFLYIYQNKQ